MKKIFLLAIAVSLLGWSACAFAGEDVLALHHQGKKPGAETPAKAASQSALEKISTKLDQLLKAQEDILKQFEEIKKELYIIKVRATR